MSNSKRVYLDNAATSWPKPAAVYDAVEEYLRNSGAAAGQGIRSCSRCGASDFRRTAPRRITHWH